MNAPIQVAGARLKEARENAGLSQRALAKKADVPQGTISTLEEGKNLNPKIESLSRLATALGLTMPRIFGAENGDAGELRMVPFNDTIRWRSNPRFVMDPSEFKSIMDSIEAKGIDIPLLGRPGPFGTIEIVAGQRRWMAVDSLVHDDKVPADYPIPIRVRDMDDGDALLAAVTENVNREAMHPLDEGKAFKTLRDEHDVSTVEQAIKFGLLKRTIQSRIALVEKLTAETKDEFRLNQIKLAHAEALTRADTDDQPALVQRIRTGSIRTEAQLVAEIEKLAQTDIEDHTSEPDKNPAGNAPTHQNPDAAGPGSLSGTGPGSSERKAGGEAIGEPPAAMPSPGQPATSEPPAAASSEDPERPAFLDRVAEAAAAEPTTFNVRLEHTYAAEGTGVNQAGVDLARFDLQAFLCGLGGITDATKIRRIVIEQET